MLYFRYLLAAAIISFAPTLCAALSSTWVPYNFGEYIDNLNALGRPYKITYGHFAGIEPLTVEDTTSERSADFRASGYVSKLVSARADFALVDPRPTPHHAAQVAVLLTKYWDSAPSPFTEAKDPQGYRYLNFIDLVDPAHGDRIIIFKVNSDGTLGSYLGDYMFTGPFSAAQARELAGCVFNGACTDTDIPHLRALPYLHN